MTEATILALIKQTDKDLSAPDQSPELIEAIQDRRTVLYELASILRFEEMVRNKQEQ